MILSRPFRLSWIYKATIHDLLEVERKHREKIRNEESSIELRYNKKHGHGRMKKEGAIFRRISSRHSAERHLFLAVFRVLFARASERERTAARFVHAYSPVIAIDTSSSSASSPLSSSKLNGRAFLSSRTRQASAVTVRESEKLGPGMHALATRNERAE